MYNESNNRGIELLKQTTTFLTDNIDNIKNLILSTPVLADFVSNIEIGQKLVLDIPKETMEKIVSGALKTIKTKDGVMKAILRDSSGKINQQLNVKFEDFCNIPDATNLMTIAQMASISQQLSEITVQLETITTAVQSVLIGQQNDRIALYKSGEELYLEACFLKNGIIKDSLMASAIKTLEDSRMKMIEAIKTDINDIIALDNKEIKMNSKQIDDKMYQINISFDIINKSSLLKAGIYYELEEYDAMIFTLKQYANFISEQIVNHSFVLYKYDDLDKKIEDGTWSIRSEQIPQQINALIEQYSSENYMLELDYDNIKQLGEYNNG